MHIDYMPKGVMHGKFSWHSHDFSISLKLVFPSLISRHDNVQLLFFSTQGSICRDVLCQCPPCTPVASLWVKKLPSCRHPRAAHLPLLRLHRPGCCSLRFSTCSVGAGDISVSGERAGLRATPRPQQPRSHRTSSSVRLSRLLGVLTFHHAVPHLRAEEAAGVSGWGTRWPWGRGCGAWRCPHALRRLCLPVTPKAGAAQRVRV